MVQAGKNQSTLKEMERMKISIMGVSEMRWLDSSYCDIDGHRVYYSGPMNSKYEHGVGILVHRR